MSHISTVELHVTDLNCLESACLELGLEFVRDVTSYRWFGIFVGDAPLPHGFSKSELGKCEHVIRIPGDGTAYEVGVVSRRDGKPGYTLLWDSWQGGYGLQAHVGENCGKLSQTYATHVATNQARRQGYSVRREVLANGKVQLTCSR